MFLIPLDTAVFTTKYVLESCSDIIFVSHDDDGYWQFQGSENIISDDDIKLVRLDEILEIDPSIKLLGNMDRGFEAHRLNKNSEWKIVGRS